jgi:hypothetical protein
MTAVRLLPFLVGVVVVLTAAGAGAQTVAVAEPPPASTGAPTWSGSASLFTYVVPDEANFVQPSVTLDRGWLHLEGRFNYEDLDTASMWIGRNFSVGERVTLEITPMAGVVVGNTDGVALGYSGSLAWRRLDLSSETEYVFTPESADRFLYTWSELGWSAGWFRGGLTVQRTRVYQTAFDIQRGVFAGITIGRAEVSTYLFNPDDSPTVVVGVALTF